VSCEVIKGGEGPSVGFGAASQCRESCVVKYKELMT
jgi:hypothetical protein